MARRESISNVCDLQERLRAQLREPMAIRSLAYRVAQHCPRGRTDRFLECRAAEQILGHRIRIAMPVDAGYFLRFKTFVRYFAKGSGAPLSEGDSLLDKSETTWPRRTEYSYSGLRVRQQLSILQNCNSEQYETPVQF